MFFFIFPAATTVRRFDGDVLRGLFERLVRGARFNRRRRRRPSGDAASNVCHVHAILLLVFGGRFRSSFWPQPAAAVSINPGRLLLPLPPPERPPRDNVNGRLLHRVQRLLR